MKTKIHIYIILVLTLASSVSIGQNPQNFLVNESTMGILNAGTGIYEYEGSLDQMITKAIEHANTGEVASIKFGVPSGKIPIFDATTVPIINHGDGLIYMMPSGEYPNQGIIGQYPTNWTGDIVGLKVNTSSQIAGLNISGLEFENFHREPSQVSSAASIAIKIEPQNLGSIGVLSGCLFTNNSVSILSNGTPSILSVFGCEFNNWLVDAEISITDHGHIVIQDGGNRTIQTSWTIAYCSFNLNSGNSLTSVSNYSVVLHAELPSSGMNNFNFHDNNLRVDNNKLIINDFINSASSLSISISDNVFTLSDGQVHSSLAMDLLNPKTSWIINNNTFINTTLTTRTYSILQEPCGLILNGSFGSFNYNTFTYDNSKQLFPAIRILGGTYADKIRIKDLDINYGGITLEESAKWIEITNCKILNLILNNSPILSIGANSNIQRPINVSSNLNGTTLTIDYTLIGMDPSWDDYRVEFFEASSTGELLQYLGNKDLVDTPSDPINNNHTATLTVPSNINSRIGVTITSIGDIGGTEVGTSPVSYSTGVSDPCPVLDLTYVDNRCSNPSEMNFNYTLTAPQSISGFQLQWMDGNGFDITTPAATSGMFDITTNNLEAFSITMNLLDGNGTVLCQNVVEISSACCDCKDTFAPIIGKKYVISAWVKEDNPNNDYIEDYVNAELQLEYIGSTDPDDFFQATGEIIDGWQRIEATFIIPASTTDLRIHLANLSLNANHNVFFDDIRIHPFNASFKSYVYDPISLRLWAELDDRNYATFYEYDEEGKLIRIKKETERGIQTIQESRTGNFKDVKPVAP